MRLINREEVRAKVQGAGVTPVPSDRTFRNMERRGDFPPAVIVNGRSHWSEAAVDAAIARWIRMAHPLEAA